MARDKDLDLPPQDLESPSAGKPDRQPPEIEATGPDADLYDTDRIDKKYWENCLADAERAEHDWRQRGREIVKIYRNDGAYTALGKKKANSGQTFNILYSNTEVMQPAIYAKPPQAVVRSRFVRKSTPVPPMPPPPMPGPIPPAVGPLAPPGMGAGAPPPGVPPQLGAAPGGGVPPGALPPAPPPMEAPGNPSLDINVKGIPAIPPQPLIPPPLPPEGPPVMPQMLPMPMPPGMPDQDDIETAASVMEKALEIVLDDDVSHEAIKAAVKDVLLPGRGTCRVRWKPVIETKPVEDPVMGGNLSLPGEPPPPQGEAPLTEDTKVWETVNDEYVYWEDILFDPVRQFADGNWLAFRHLFDRQSLLGEFPDSEQLQKLEQEGKLGELLRWTEESAAKSAVGGG